MIDWLFIWGAKQATGFVFKPILEELATDATKDWAKDMFKCCLSNIIKLPQKEPLEKAAGKALKEFLALFQQELEDADLENEQVKEYLKPLRGFIRIQDVQEILGKPFQEEEKGIDVHKLAQLWQKELPDTFDWNQLSKRYVRKVKAIIREDDELRKILDSQNLEKIAENTKNLTGIIPDYDLIRYRESIQESYGHLKLSKLDSTFRNQPYQVKLRQIFIPQTVKEALSPSRFDLPKEVLENLRAEKAIEESFFERDFEQYQQLFMGKPSQSILDIINDEKYQYIVFLGDPGSGKSTLLQYLALDWAENPTERIPLLIELRNYAKDENAPKDFLDYFHLGKRKICELNQNQLHEKLLTGNALVMFDGLDEIFNNDTYGRVIREIHAFSNKYKQVQIIITSRIVGYNPDELRNVPFTHFTLEDFNSNQIRRFIKKWHQLALPEESSQVRYETQKRLQTAINDSPAIRQLAGNPLLLTMMAILNRYQKLPSRRIDLYEKATDVLLYQWEIEYKKMELTLDDVDLRAKQGMLRDIAYRMQASEKGLKGNIIHRDDLENAIADYYYNRLRGKESRAIAGKIITQLRERNFILSYLGYNCYGFVHRVFFEYFCAMAFVGRFNKRGLEGGLTIEELQEQVFGKHWQDKSWHEVLKLISGKLNEFVEDVINYLIGIYEETKDISVLILAQECLNEVNSQVELEDIKNRLLNALQNALETDDIKLMLNSIQKATLMNQDYIAVKKTPETLYLASLLKKAQFIIEHNQLDNNLDITLNLQKLKISWRELPEMVKIQENYEEVVSLLDTDKPDLLKKLQSSDPNERINALKMLVEISHE